MFIFIKSLKLPRSFSLRQREAKSAFQIYKICRSSIITNHIKIKMESTDTTQVQEKKSAGKDCILAIDQGTTSSRVLVVDQDLKVVDSASGEHAQITPKPGWVEHSPEEIFGNVSECLQEVCSQPYSMFHQESEEVVGYIVLEGTCS